MRNFRSLVAIFVVITFVAVPNMFGKVCHPKKPITCTAATLSPADVAAPVAAAPTTAPVAKPKATAIQTQKPATQQAMICGPWVKWMCTSTPLI